MRAITKLAKIHPAAKKCCGWEKPAICRKDDIFRQRRPNQSGMGKGDYL